MAWRAASTAQKVAIVVGLLIVLLGLSAILSRPGGPHAPSGPTPQLLAQATISIETTAQPRMTARQVADLVVSQIQRNEALLGRSVAPIRILSVIAVAGDRIGEVQPGAAALSPPVSGIVWVVRAEGTFTTNRGLASPPPTAASGYYLVLDADGSVLGMGFPLASPVAPS